MRKNETLQKLAVRCKKIARLATVPVAVVAAALWTAVVLPYARAGQGLSEARAAASRANVPVQAADLESGTVPPSANAALLYSRIADVAPDHKSDRLEQARQSLLRGDTVSALAELKNWDRGLELATQAAARPSCRFEHNWSEPLTTVFPEFSLMKGAAKALHLRAWARGLDGDVAGAVQDIQTLRQLARHSAMSPTMIGQLVACNVDSLAATAARRVAAASRGDQAALAKVAAALGTEARFPDARKTLAGESYVMVYISRHADRELVSTTATNPENQTASLAPRWLPVPMARSAYEARALEFWSGVFEATDQHKEDPISQMEAVALRAKAVRLQSDPSYRLLAAYLPEMSLMANAYRKRVAYERTALALISALQYEAKSGQWPQSTAFVDPFNGTPLGTSASKDGFIVWSIGPDRLDDRGAGPERNGKKGAADDIAAIVPEDQSLASE